jgi:phosphoglycolate phosphatase-like HAD superfamily hydrolase
MINFSKYKVILWDFDGVLMDSMPVRDRGFEIVLSSYPQHEVEQLLIYHRQNGGLSRYVKFKYFFEQIRKEPITSAQVDNLASEFSEVMRRELVNSELLIDESVEYVKQNHKKFKMHVVSGSDQTELRYLCEVLGLKNYFESINGSPTPKKELVNLILNSYKYTPKEIVLIGDSMNDYDAASMHEIDFYGYNNTSLEGIGVGYIQAFDTVFSNS